MSKRTEKKKKKRVQHNKSMKLRRKMKKAEDKRQNNKTDKIRKRLDVIGPPDTVDVFEQDV